MGTSMPKRSVSALRISWSSCAARARSSPIWSRRPLFSVHSCLLFSMSSSMATGRTLED